MPSRFFRLLLCLFVVVLPVAAHADSRPNTIMFFGDSLVAGYGLAREEALPAQVAAHLRGQGYNVTVFNDGVSGDTTSGGRQRMDWALNRKNPDIVVLALGGNDLLRGIQPGLVLNNLEAMIKMLQARKIKVILVSMQAPSNYDAAYAADFNAIYPTLGGRYSVPVYPPFLQGIFGVPGYMLADGIHPNAHGVAYIAGHLGDYLASTKWLRKADDKK